MTEREIIDGQFPRVPKELVYALLPRVLDGEEANRIYQSARVKDSKDHLLFKFMCKLGDSGAQDYNQFMKGALLVRESLDGLNLPEVTIDTMNTYWAELLAFGERSKQISSPFESGFEFNMPNVFDYHDENPELMLAITYLGNDGRMGGLNYYELKRRQFHSDRMVAG